MFDAIAAHVATGLGMDHELTVEPKISGPLTPADDRFALALTDVGFLCPPSYLWLTEESAPSVQLVPMAPVHDDPRAHGRPVYYSDLIVRAESPIAGLGDLAGQRVGYNDKSSLSGYVSLLTALAAIGAEQTHFGQFLHVGSHREALAMIAAGEIDGAAIDANVWRAWAREQPDAAGELRSAAALGPHPVQPIVVRSGAAHLAEPIAELLACPELAELVRPHGVVGFAPIDHAAYEPLRPMCRALAPG